MTYDFLDILSTASVLAAQEAHGARAFWERFPGHRESRRFTDNETAFIASRDSFYMATVSESGWPYVQHRGGPPGFLKVLDETTLGFLDFRGNRQYISLGNVEADDRVALILMDYPRRGRLKILAHMKVVGLDEDPSLLSQLALADYKGKPERAFLLQLEAFDWNCQQHITPRFTSAEIEQAMAPVMARLRELELENSELRSRLPGQPPTG
jgi:uncharacterized protein